MKSSVYRLTALSCVILHEVFSLETDSLIFREVFSLETDGFILREVLREVFSIETDNFILREVFSLETNGFILSEVVSILELTGLWRSTITFILPIKASSFVKSSA